MQRRPPFTLEFYEDENGNEPVLQWLRSDLTAMQRRAIGLAMYELLEHEGIDVCKTEFGKALGEGLYEFRLRHDGEEILARKSPLRLRVDRITGRSERILLRVFFHPHGDKMILLLGGYDKRRFPKRQDKEIAVARKRLGEWKRSQASRAAQGEDPRRAT